MSAALQLVSESAHLMAPADEAHRRLKTALAKVEQDYWALADAIAAAHAAEVWLRDDRAHEARYRQIMRDDNFGSVFEAYVYDEFGMRKGITSYHVIAGRLRQLVDKSPTTVGGLDWSRFTLNVVRPISSAIISTYAADDVGASLVTAQRLADKDGTDRNPAPQVKPSHVRAALKEHGLVPPRARGLDEMQADERKAARIAIARERMPKDATTLIDGKDIGAVVEVIESMIRRLSDQPRAIDRIRKALG